MYMLPFAFDTSLNEVVLANTHNNMSINTEHDKNEDAKQLYLQMLVQGLLPNMMTFSGMLKACGNMGDIQKGNNFHVQMSSQNMEVTETSALIEKHD